MTLSFEQPSAFESVLKFLNRPGALVRNVLKGNVEGAYRQGGDILGDIFDATLPGDWIPEFSRKQDTPEFSDVIGNMQPGPVKSIVDIAGGIATDPLTYIGLGPVVKSVAGVAGQGIRSAAKASPTVANVANKAVTTLDKWGHNVRAATGNMSPAASAKTAIDIGRNAENAVVHAGQGYAIPAFKDVPKAISDKAQLIINDTVLDPATNKVVRLGIEGPEFGTKSQQMDIIEQRLAKSGFDDATKDAVRDYLSKSVDFTRKQWEQNVTPLKAGGRQIMESKLIKDPVTGESLAPLDYHPRAWELDEVPGYVNAKASVSRAGATPNVAMSRSIREKDKFVQFYNDLVDQGKLNPLGEADAATIWSKYVEQLGRKTKLANAAENLLPGGLAGNAYNRADVTKKLIEQIDAIAARGDLDTAKYLKTNLFGLEPRQFEGFAKLNQAFKPFATAGSVIPRAAFNVRNSITSIAQTISDPQARKVVLDYVKNVPAQAVGGGAMDWLRQLGANFSPGRLDTVKAIAARTGGNEVEFLKALEATDANLAKAFRNGVLDSGFGSVEQKIAKATGPKTTWEKIKNVVNAPQAWTSGTENRLRLGLFESLIKSGVAEKEAAQIVKRTMYDYNYSSEANRFIRDIVPFGQFTMQAAPQFARFALEGTPGLPSLGKAVVPGVGALYRSSDAEHPLPQYLANQPTIPLGSEGGESKYLSSLGMPFETLASLPNPSDDIAKFGRQTEQGIVSQLNPALKFGYSMVAGHDPYFGSEFAGYSKTPAIAQAMGAPETSEAARYYNLIASTGAIQPLATPVQLLSQATETKTSIPEKIVNLSGIAKIATVNDQQALQQQISNYLSTNPKAQEYKTFYTKTQDEDTLAALAELQRVKQEIKKRKKAGE